MQYHRAYTPAPLYLVQSRLGVAFMLGGMINVIGVVYLAVTPKCVMGGGALYFGLDIGPVSAWLDVGKIEISKQADSQLTRVSIAMDVFIQFKPFHYRADISVSIGCSISIKVWFVRERISASVGAALHIEGPDPFGGVGACNEWQVRCTCADECNLLTSTSTCSGPRPTSAQKPRLRQQSVSRSFTRWWILQVLP